MDSTETTERRSPTDPRDPAFEIPDEITYELKKPFKRVAGGGEVLTRLSFRPPTVGEMKKVERCAAKDGEAAAAIKMMALLSNDNLTEPDVERINFVDFQICSEQLRPFLELAAPSAKKD